MSSAVTDILNLAWSIKQMCDGAKETKKLLKAVGYEISIAMEICIKSDTQASLTADSQDLLRRLQNNMLEIKMLVEKVASMNKIKFIFKASDIQKEIEDKLRVYHILLQTLNTTMLVGVSAAVKEFELCQNELRAAVHDEKEEVRMLLKANQAEVLNHLSEKYTSEEIKEAMDELKRDRDDLRAKNKDLVCSNKEIVRGKEEQEGHYMDQIISILSMASLGEQKKQHMTDDCKQKKVQQLPPSCYCPITFELLKDPVIVDANCSHTVSRKCMEKWTENNRTTCPVCNSVLRSYYVSPNTQLRETIEFLVSSNTQSQKCSSDASVVQDDSDISVLPQPSMNTTPSAKQPTPSKLHSLENEEISSTKTVIPDYGKISSSLQTSSNTTPSKKLAKSSKTSLLENEIVAFQDALKILHGECSEMRAIEAFELLRKTSRENSTCVVIDSAGGIPAIIHCMQRHMASDVVQEMACASLTNIATNVDKQIAIVSAGGIPVIITCMQIHVNSAAVQEQACASLSRLASNDDNRSAIASAGGIPVLITCMQEHITSATVQEQACAALSNLAYIDDNKVAIASGGGIPLIITCMQRHAVSVSVQDWACTALGNLAYRNAKNQAAIASAGGIPLIITYMKKYITSAYVQEQACAALCNMAYRNAKNKRAITAAGGKNAALCAKAAHVGTNTVERRVETLLYMLKT